MKSGKLLTIFNFQFNIFNSFENSRSRTLKSKTLYLSFSFRWSPELISCLLLFCFQCSDTELYIENCIRYKRISKEFLIKLLLKIEMI